MKSSICNYKIYEPDLEMLRRLVQEKQIEECIVYGAGSNGEYFAKCLIAMNVNIKCFIDVQAETKPFFLGKEVFKPENIKNVYCGEYVLVSPNIFSSIIDYIKSIGIKDDKILLPFYVREEVAVDYGYYLDKPSDNIEYCFEDIKCPTVTITSIIYNTPEYLFRRAIESILKQSFRNFYYVIIINGATDNSKGIALEYEKKDSRIKVITLDKNYKWTDKELLSEVANNLKGDYWCQLDGDDYYAEEFLKITVGSGENNKADMVAVRTMAIAADKDFDLMKGNASFDGKDKYWFYHGNPACHAFSQNNIMKEFASGRISGTWWGKLWSMSVVKSYFEYLLDLSDDDRGCFFRLDTAMTYKMLTLCNRVYFSDKVLHFQSYSPGRTTYSKAPVEWLMSLWFVYKDLRDRFFCWYDYDTALKYVRKFLNIFTKWMFARKDILKDIDESPYASIVFENLKELYDDKYFMESVIKRSFEGDVYKSFYQDLINAVGEEDIPEVSNDYLNANTQYRRVIGYGALGNNSFELMSRLRNTRFFPTELWDCNGDNQLIKKPCIDSLDENDLVIIFPTAGKAVSSIKSILNGSKAKVVEHEDISRWLFENASNKS